MPTSLSEDDLMLKEFDRVGGDGGWGEEDEHLISALRYRMAKKRLLTAIVGG
jgi:hypothetical protein